jgi:hypothetical protein
MIFAMVAWNGLQYRTSRNWQCLFPSVQLVKDALYALNLYLLGRCSQFSQLQTYHLIWNNFF